MEKDRRNILIQTNFDFREGLFTWEGPSQIAKFNVYNIKKKDFTDSNAAIPTYNSWNCMSRVTLVTVVLI